MSENQVLGLALRGAAATILSSGAGLGIQIVGTVVLARLLTPRDFGLITLVTTFSLLLVNFGLNGFTEAVLQREEISDQLISNLFWINTGVSIVLTLGFAAAGSILAHFYHEPLVARITSAIAPMILLTSLSVQHAALLRRAMRFSTVSANDLLSRAVSLLVSIGFAWWGFGYWALVIGNLAQPISQCIGAWYLCRWVPRLPRRFPGTLSMVTFAMNVYGRFSLNYVARNIDNVLVGSYFGAQALGFYKKAYDLFALSASQLSAPLTNVAVSALSRFKPCSSEYREHLLSGISVLTFLGMGLSAIFTIIGKDLIRLLLGPQWAQAGQIFTFFGPGIGIMVIYYSHGWLYLSAGGANRWLRWGVIEVAVTCLLFLAALPWGPVGIACAWTVSYWTLTVPSFWYGGTAIGFRVSLLLRATFKYVASSLLAGLSAAAIDRLQFLNFIPAAQTTLGRVVSLSMLVGVLYLAFLVVLHGGYDPLRRIAVLLKSMASSRKINPERAVVVGQNAD